MLVKKSIILKGEGIIDYNYHYELMKRIYEALTLSDNKRAIKLHNEGVLSDGKRFKLFNYTLAFDKNVSYLENGISFNKDNCIKLIISGDDKILNSIIKGIVLNGKIKLNENELKVVELENDKDVKFNNIMLYKVRSPIVESVYEDGVKYTNPYTKEWYSALANNLKRKYKAVYNEEYDKDIFFDIENILNIKKKMITKIKKGFVIGYTDFEIFIEADPKMQKIAYYLGLGQNSSIGMGAISYIKGWKNGKNI